MKGRGTLLTAIEPRVRPGSFREDINGLRALAIVSVLLFHFDVPGFSGGFSGVDVFFVISGYLMTAIITRRLDAGTFSILGFYVDRARRIIPALLVVCIALLTVGWFCLVPSEFLAMGKHVTGALTFTSNILFWREAGYFDEITRSKWLIHTWSLSVEWQFYVLYPLAFVVVHHFCKPQIRIVLVIVTLASLFVAVLLAQSRPIAGFYLLPSRIWEMTAGGLVCLAPLPRRVTSRQRHCVEIAGLAMIAAAILAFATAAAWPGWRAILPVAGTALVIAAGRERSVVTGNAVFAWIGRSSYSIYLWHWPIVVALVYIAKEDEPKWQAAGMAAAFVVGWLSYRVVELPAQRWIKAARGTRCSSLIGSALLALPMLVAATGAGIWLSRGAPQRFAPEVALADDARPWVNKLDAGCFAQSGVVLPPCILGPGSRKVAADMIGDSHASATVTALVAAAPAGSGIRFRAYASCPTLLGAVSFDPESHCDEFNRRYLGEIIAGPASATPVVIADRWQSYMTLDTIGLRANAARADGVVLRLSPSRLEERLTQTVCAITAKRPTFIILPVPDYPVRIPQALARALISDPSAPEIYMPLNAYWRRNGAVIAMLNRVAARCGARLLDPVPGLCPGGKCQASAAHLPLYTDDHHLNELGNRRLIPMFRAVFAR